MIMGARRAPECSLMGPSARPDAHRSLSFSDRRGPLFMRWARVGEFARINLYYSYE